MEGYLNSIEPILKTNGLFVFYPWWLRINALLFAPCFFTDHESRVTFLCEKLMPAIASLEDLKAAQKDLCYSMRVCLKRSDPQVKRSSSDSDP